MENHKIIDQKTRGAIKKKELLRLIYKDYYKKISDHIYLDQNFKILEIGSGPGNVKEIINNCITSDQFIDSNIDQVQNIYNLSFKDSSISNIIMLDVFHHLEFPALALKEIHRVLIKNGRIIMVEPGMGIIPKFIFKIFHSEPLGLEMKIDWKKIPNFIPNLDSYFAAQSIPWRAFYNKELNLENKFTKVEVEPFSDFAYLASGGYSYPSFYPMFLYKVVKKIDEFLTLISKKIFSARILVVLSKNCD
jgi:SAM-dependent methyltransferase